MRLADIRIRKEPFYRRQAVEDGLRRLGYSFVREGAKPSSKKDVLVLWNRKRGKEDMEATAWEQHGGTVIVMENGYLQKVDKTLYAISAGQHNGAGFFPVGDEDRFSTLGFQVKPWRTGGEYVLVCSQRGIGSPLMASPPQWAEKTVRKIQPFVKSTGLTVKLRAHPGNFAPKTPLVEDLKAAHVCVIWSSGAGVRALVEGVPVCHDAPHWICQYYGGTRDAESWRNPFRDDASRKLALHVMSHGQWTVDEISNSEPFARILENPP